MPEDIWIVKWIYPQGAAVLVFREHDTAAKQYAFWVDEIVEAAKGDDDWAVSKYVPDKPGEKYYGMYNRKTFREDAVYLYKSFII